jgi:hypothetical protein
MSNKIIERKYQSMIGAEVIGIDGCREPYTGIVKQLSVEEHRVLGTFAQVWVEWDYNLGHLEPYYPSQFRQWNGRHSGIGVYLAPKEAN